MVNEEFKAKSRDFVNSPSLEILLRELRSSNTDPLRPEEEVSLAKRIQKGDLKAKESLVTANLRFVITIAKLYRDRGLPFEDLISAGYSGLLTATDRFDETRGFKFISYAVWWIRQGILVALNEQSRTIRIPVNRTDILYKIFNYANTHNEDEISDLDSDSELLKIANGLGVSLENLRTARNYGKPVLSLDSGLEGDGEESLYNLVEDTNQLSPDKNLLDEEQKKGICAVLDTLEPREAEILRAYYGLNGEEPQTLERIGDKYNLTRERVRQIKEFALKKLRQPRNVKKLQSYL